MKPVGVLPTGRFYSSPATSPSQSSTASQTETPLSPPEAKSRAQAIIDLLPGNTNFAKTAYATIGTGLGAFLITKGIYIPNDETLVLIAFALTTRVLYNKLSGPLSEYLEQSIAELREKWLASSITEKEKLVKMIEELEGFRDHSAVTEAHYATLRENIQLQAELDAVLAKNQFLMSVKCKLDEAMRREAEKQAAERKAKAETLIASLNAALKEPKMQEAILKKCLVDLEKMPAMKMD